MRIVSRRAATAFGHDIVMAAAAFALSLYLRVGDDFIDFSQGLFWFYDAAFTVTAAAVFFWAGLYRGIWRYASLPDLLALARAVTLVILIYFPLMFLVTRLEGLPRSLVAIDWLVLMALLGGPRFVYRLLKDGSLDQFLSSNAGRGGVPVLLIGASEDADLFIRAVSRGAKPLYRVVGIVTDDAQRVGRDIGGVPVLGTIDQTAEIIRQLDGGGGKPQRLILSGRTLDGTAVRRLLDLADALGIPLARLPRLTEFREPTKNTAQPIEPVAIEDLLGRPQAVLDRAGMARSDPGPPRPGHRRRRHHRLRTLAPDRRLRAGAALPARQRRIRAVRHRPRNPGAIPRCAPARADRRHARPRPHRRDHGR